MKLSIGSVFAGSTSQKSNTEHTLIGHEGHFQAGCDVADESGTQGNPLESSWTRVVIHITYTLVTHKSFMALTVTTPALSITV